MIAIRPLQRKDREDILRLLEARKTFPDYEIKVALEVIDDALQFPERGDYQVYCAFEGEGLLAGYVCFGRIPMTDACFDLYWIAVDERRSRNGIGRQLLHLMENVAQAQGARRIYIETSSLPAFEAARSFYKKNHYELVSVLTDFYKPNDHKMVFMKSIEPIVPGPA